MDPPPIGSMWKHKVLKNDNWVITIVAPQRPNNISYQYHKDRHIGGCKSSQWFYSEWDKL